MRRYFCQKLGKKLQIGLVLLLINSGLSVPIYRAAAEITLPPKGVSQELWKAYQEVVISNIGGGDRNLRWNTNPSFYVSGNPTAADNNTFQGTLAEVRRYCPNIQPNIVTSEPFEGVILKYLPRSEFKNLISNTPDSAVSSYASYLYYLNRGLTKFTAAVSTDTNQNQRDTDTQIRIYQGFGLLGYTKNTNARMFSWMFPNAGTISASELDKQIIRLYCSSYSRSWDTSQQTFDLISTAWSKKINVPSMGLNIKVGEYKNQLNFAFNFDPGQALDNQLTAIQYSIFDSSGSMTSSGKLDVSENLFKSHQVVLTGIKDNSRYKIEAFPVNSNGNGPISRGEGRAGATIAPTDSGGANASDASAEVLDARNAASDAIDAANESLAAFGRYRTSCIEISIEFETPEQELFDSTNLDSYCEQLDEKVASLDAKIGALDPDKATSTDQANKLTDQANVFAEEADEFVAQIQDYSDELLATKNQMASIIKILNPINQAETEVIEAWEQLQERLTILPVATGGAIKKSKGYKSAMTYKSQVANLVKSRDLQLEEFLNIERPTQLTLFALKLTSLKINTASINEFKKLMVGINKLIPTSVCQKGNAVILASKSGKCAKGFELIPTS